MLNGTPTILVCVGLVFVLCHLVQLVVEVAQLSSFRHLILEHKERRLVPALNQIISREQNARL